MNEGRENPQGEICDNREVYPRKTSTTFSLEINRVTKVKKMQRAKSLGISPSEMGVVAFTLLYMLTSLFATVRGGNREFIFYFFVMLLLSVVVWLVHLRVRFHIAALWGLSIWGLAHMAGGLMPIPDSWPIIGESHVLYNWVIVPGLLKYDQLVHAFGFGLVTWLCWQSLQSAFIQRGCEIKPTLGLMALCMAAGMGFGAANEVVEFIATLIFPGTNVGGYNNTGWDLIANLAGSFFAAVTVAIRTQKTRDLLD